jgi:hypothetical protein
MMDVINIRTDGRPRTQYLYVGRGSTWGNKYKITRYQNRQEVLHRFLITIISMSDDERKAWLKGVAEALRQGKPLGCYCAPEDCHAMILAAYARHHYNLDPRT